MKVNREGRGGGEAALAFDATSVLTLMGKTML